MNSEMSYLQPRARPNPSTYRTNLGRAQSETLGNKHPQVNPSRSVNILPSTNVFINYIPAEFTEMDLCNLCQPYGQIICCKIMINLETGKSKGFGFVRFATLEQAKFAIQSLNRKQIGNKRLLAKYAESKEKEEQISTMIYVKGLPVSVDTNYVYQDFSRFGEIQHLQPHLIEYDSNSWRCFIRYSTYQSAALAISAMNNKIIAPTTKPLHVKYANESCLSGNYMPQFPVMQYPEKSVTYDSPDVNLLPSFLLH